MRSRDRRIHRHGPVDLPRRVGFGEDLREHTIPGAITGIAAVPLPHRLPRPELAPWEIPPWDPRPEPVRDPLDHPPVITERMTPHTRIRRQQRLDPRPLLIREHPIPRPVDLTPQDCGEPHHRYGRYAPVRPRSHGTSIQVSSRILGRSLVRVGEPWTAHLSVACGVRKGFHGQVRHHFSQHPCC